jgi:Flp pilus assembly protein TadG
MMVVLIAFVGLAIDAGRLFIARAELVRAVDAAALAGTLELPNLTAAQAKVFTYMAENEPDAAVEAPISPVERQIEVRGTKSVDVIFMRVFGFGPVEVSASATAGFGILAVDTVMTIDRTLSMQGTPLTQAKIAAKNFTDVLLSSSQSSSETLVGVAPYSNCYQPPWVATPGPTPTRTRTRTPTPNGYHGPTPTPPGPTPTPSPSTNNYCTPGSMVVGLTNDKALVESKIDSITANGSTNICLGLNKANEVLFGAQHHTVSNTLRIVVLLSDGQNMYTADSYDGQGQPPVSCRPNTDPSHPDGQIGTGCYNAQTRQKELDIKTKQLVDGMKANGVEVYIVGFGVCGTRDVTTLCQPSKIGGSYHDNTANRNLLKCLASSSPGTNDHYFEATSASELPGIFNNIARLIGFRLIK